MCLSHEQERPKRCRKGKSSATKAQRESSATKQQEKAVKVSADHKQHQTVKSSHKKKSTTSTTTIQPVFSSTNINIDAAAKDTAPPDPTFRSDSAPLPLSPCSHHRKRSSSECSCTVHKNCKRKHRFVVSHDYHDHASSPSIEGVLPMGTDTGYYDDQDDIYQPTPAKVRSMSTTTTKSSHQSLKSETFPYRLYRMIEDAHAEGNSDIIHFMPHGRAFRVEDHDGLVDKILGRYFQQSKYVSFQRQLSIYGFQKLTVGTDQGAYYNEWFLRGKPELLGSIKRVRVKGTGSKGAYDPDGEPDLYRVGPWLPEFGGLDVDQSTEKEAMITLSSHTMTSISSVTRGSQSDEKEAMITLSSHTMTSISSVTRGSQSDSKPSARGPNVTSTFEEKMTIPSKVAIPTDLGLEALLVSDDSPSIVTPMAGTKIFDTAGNISIPPLPSVASQESDIITSSGMSPSIYSMPPLDTGDSNKATESIGIEPVPLQSEDKNISTSSYFDWNAAGMASGASIPSSLHTFAQDCLSRQPFSSLFRSPSFTSLFDSSTVDNRKPREISACTNTPSFDATCNAKTSTTQASQELESCDDCSSICSEESVQRFLESVFDDDTGGLNEFSKPPQAPTMAARAKEQDPSMTAVVDGSKIPYAEV